MAPSYGWSMSSFTWSFEDADGQPVDAAGVGQPAKGFATQADAEAWVGETWRDLLAATHPAETAAIVSHFLDRHSATTTTG